MNSLIKFLPKADIYSLVCIVHGFALCDTQEKYIKLFHDLKNLIPFDYATSALVTTNKHGIVESYDIVNINYTSDWINAYNEQAIYKIDITVEDTLKHFKTQCWSDTFKKYGYPKKLLSFAHDFNLLNGYSCGAKQFGLYKRPSIVTFSWNFKEKNKYISAIIDSLTPHIHIALSNLYLSGQYKLSKRTLTKREKEIISWVKEGKSSWEISEILKISEVTVNFHAANVMRKLNALNRAQAVAVALQHGIIDF